MYNESNFNIEDLGGNLLETLTTGMYRNSETLYREYIQNSCDAIDEAVKAGLLQDTLIDGKVKVFINKEERTIKIVDNGIGILASDFISIMKGIGKSKKDKTVNKGFRGIGKLIGLAYCEKIIFTTKSSGENKVSSLILDAVKFKKLIGEGKLNLIEIFNQISQFNEPKTIEEYSKNMENKTYIETVGMEADHFFMVELYGINKTNTNLLSEKLIQDYLSFVLPVPYHTNFNMFANKIKEHAKNLNYKIDEYDVRVGGQEITKKYTVNIKGRNDDTTEDKKDKIFDIETFDFHGENGDLIAWMWVGISNFKKAIPLKHKKEIINPMRGIRLRKCNIQIGDEGVFRDYFSEKRGNDYFVGEVFGVSGELEPNSQRDFFKENEKRIEFEKELKEKFFDNSDSIYHVGSELNSTEQVKKSYKSNQDKLEQIDYADDVETSEEINKIQEEMEKQKTNIEEKESKIQKRIDNISDEKLKTIAQKVKDNRRAEELREEELRELDSQPESSDIDNSTKNEYNTTQVSLFPDSEPQISGFETYSVKEQKMIRKIFSIIECVIENKDDAKNIISKIEERLATDV